MGILEQQTQIEMELCLQFTFSFLPILLPILIFFFQIGSHRPFPFPPFLSLLQLCFFLFAKMSDPLALSHMPQQAFT